MKKKVIILGITAVMSAISFSAHAQKKFKVSGQPVEIYKDARAPIEQRVENLMSLMTLEEKINQLRSQLLFFEQYGSRDWTVGHYRNIAHFMHNGPTGPASAKACADAINEDTRKSVEASRLGIPVIQHGEALHGVQWGVGTCFPQSIAFAASFDDDFYYRCGQVVAEELRAVGVRQVYAPVVNISRDPRWGRSEEGYGEDPFLNARMGVAWTKALEQGGVVASPKHFVDNYGDGGHDSYASNVSWRVLREVFLEPFRACVEEGGARSIMAAYNSVDGVPCSANKKLLTDILRNEWNFKGYVVSDYGGLPGVHGTHHLAASSVESQPLALEAGLDVGVGMSGWDIYFELPGLVKNGKVSEETINTSLRRVLTVKFELGLFDNPYVDAKAADKIVRSKEHRDLSLEASRKVMTLLKNDKNTLPLSDKTVKKIGVFGPAANTTNTGGYSGPGGGNNGEFIKDGVTLYQGLQKRLQGKAEVVLHSDDTDISALARTCDAVIFVAAIQEGEGQDRSHLTLPKRNVKISDELGHIVDTGGKQTFEMEQEKVIDELAASGAKTIVVLQNGSVIDMQNWVNKVDAILEAWYSGEQGGTAIAETLMGDNNPGGRLPVTWVKHVGQVPMYYYLKPSGRGYGYLDDDGKPMYPFGYGLSYTTFEYSDLVIPAKVNKNGDTKVSVTVKNTGNCKGDEVVQLYLHDEIASVVRPIKELKAFKRVTLQPGESKQVKLTLPSRSFGLWDRDLNFVVEPGNFDVMIGKDAENMILKGQIKVE